MSNLNIGIMEVKLYLQKDELEIVKIALQNELDKCKLRIGRGGTYEEMKHEIEAVDVLSETIDDIQCCIEDADFNDKYGLEVTDE